MLKGKCQANWDWLVTLEEGRRRRPPQKLGQMQGEALGPGWEGPCRLGQRLFSIVYAMGGHQRVFKRPFLALGGE